MGLVSTARRRLCLGAAALLALTLPALFLPGVQAQFSDSTQRSTGFTAAGTFPGYPASVLGDGPEFYHRFDDAPSAAGSSVAADASPHGRAGTYAGATEGLSTWWKLDDLAGTTGRDAAGAANVATLGAGASWAPGRTNGAVALTAQADSHVTGKRPAVDTHEAFSISVWAYLSDTSTDRTVISQNGDYSPGFALEYSKAADRWAFAMARNNVATPTIDRVTSALAPTLHTWTHLVGTYNGTNLMSLYVDGAARTTGAHTARIRSLVTTLGRQLQGTWQAPFAGRIDDVRAFRRELDGADVTALYDGSSTGPELSWSLDDPDGGAAVDSSGNANPGAAGPGVTWSSGTRGPASTGAAAFPGDPATGYLTSTYPPIRTDRDYTVAAWAYRGAAGRTVLAQAGATHSAFVLAYSGGTWRALLSDNPSNPPAEVLNSGVSTPPATWAHLALSYDDGTQTATLYVDGVQEDQSAVTGAWNATGPFGVGREWSGGAWTAGWDGRLDDVVAYSRVLSAGEVAGLAAGSVPGAAVPMSAGQAGALQGGQGGEKASTSVGFDGGAGGGFNPVAYVNPTTFTIECWFVSAGAGGGPLLAFADGTTMTGTPDRLLYLDATGALNFGTAAGARTVITSPRTYDDGEWHHVAATLGPAGMRLYVDGREVAANSAVTTARNVSGYWHWAGPSASGWPREPAAARFAGGLDEVAVFATQLSAQQISWHYYANH
ncbi:LamG domain-containing protein [Actinoplanes sp. NPDC051859]|uniref:LamG domain-containing protein n=1 Tax=Actinoplanes sp. NPDC051859 TaxID=3363909 RepID=UPI0037ABD6F5